MGKLLIIALFQIWTVAAPGLLRGQQLEGTVTDAAGRPLAGVTLFLDQTTRGDLSDTSGRFSLSVPGAGRYLLVASHLGYRKVERSVSLVAGATLALDTLVLTQAVLPLDEIVVEALASRKWRRYLRIFEQDALGQSVMARRARLLNPEVLDFEPTEGGFQAVASAPLVVENSATGYRIHVFVEHYEHYSRSGGYQFTRRLFFEEMGVPSPAQRAARARLYQGSLQHFLWAWYHERVRAEGFMVYSALPSPRRHGTSAYAACPEPLYVEYEALPDRAYLYLARKGRVPRPLAKRRQASRITFDAGLMRATLSGQPVGTVRRAGYWAFAGLGDAVPADASAVYHAAEPKEAPLVLDAAKAK